MRPLGALALLALVACDGPPALDGGLDGGLDAGSGRVDAGPPPPFFFGLSMARPGQEAFAAELGVTHFRPTLSWRRIEPTVEADARTLEDVTSDEAVRAYASARDFGPFDEELNRIAAAGLVPLPIVGHGWTSTLPRLPAMGEDVPADPDRLGLEHYLARQYLFTRAVVERYDGDGVDDAPSGPRIALWQIENELNQAGLTAALGWRSPEGDAGLNSAWVRESFLRRLLETLARAVHDADATAQVTTNFHTDIHPAVNTTLGLSTWEQAIASWAPLLDLVSIDAYPNYYRATPVAGEVVGERVRLAREAAGGRHVFVMETGYPTGPSERGFSEAGQRTFLEAAVDSAIAEGAVGFFWFGTQTADTHDVVATEEDLENLRVLGDAFERGDVPTLLGFVRERPEYLRGHLADVITSVEPYWGLVRPDGTHKPAWDAFVSRL